MSNFKKDILRAVGEELDTAIIVVTSDYHVVEENRKFPKQYIKTKQKLKDVIEFFDYEYDSGYGGQECHDFYIFTKVKVMFIWEYDGSTYIHKVPKTFKEAVKIKTEF